MADYSLADFFQGRRPNALMEHTTLTGDPVGTSPPVQPSMHGYPSAPSERGVSNWLADYAGAPQNVANSLGALAPWTPMGTGYDIGHDYIGPAIQERNAPLGAAGGGLGALAIFAGPMARTANRPALARAQAMHTAGRSRDDIWNETGWFQGRDGQWRWEIDDSGARLSWLRRSGPLNRVMPHNNLYDAYPDVGNVRTTAVPRTPLGLIRGGYDEGSTSHWNSLSDVYWLGRPLYTRGRPEEIIYSRGQNSLPTLLHEGQHAIAAREGFERGGRGIDPDYRSISGEVEARNVERRMNMTPAERRANPPWTTQDVPDEHQIIRSR